MSARFEHHYHRLMALRDSPHSVYTLRAADGRPLYIGCTAHLARRLARHRRVQPWWDEVAAVQTVECSNYRAGRETEAALIARDQPPYNVIGTVRELDLPRRRARGVWPAPDALTAAVGGRRRRSAA